MKNQIENLFLIVLFLLLFLFSQSFLIAEDSDTLWTKNFMGSGYVSNALFSPGDKSIYVTTTEKFYELETETGKIIREIPEIRGAKFFSKDGRYAYTYDLKKADMITKEIIGDFKNPLLPWYYYDFDVCENAKMYACIIKHAIQFPLPDSTIGIFDTETFQLRKIIQLPKNYMEKVAISPDGKFIATNSLFDSLLQDENDDIYITTIWDGKTFEKITQLKIGGSTLLKFSPDGKFLGVGGGSHIFLYNTQTWQLLDTFNFDPPYDISSFTFSNDSKYIYFTRPGKNITIKDILTNTLIKELSPKRGGFFYMCLTNQSKYLVAIDDLSLFLFKNVLTNYFVDNVKNNVTISPNPVKDFIDISGLELPVKNISIFDINGNLVFTKSNLISSESNLKLDLSFLQKGTYLINIKTSDKEYSAKFIKE